MTPSQKWFDRMMLVFVLGLLCAIVFVGYAKAAETCQTVRGCHAALAWQKKNARHLAAAVTWQKSARRAQARQQYQASVDTGFALAEIIYGMPTSEAKPVGTCESGLDPLERNSETATGVMQELDSTFHRTPFGGITVKVGKRRVIGSFDAIVNILAAGYIWHRDGGSWREWVCGYKAGGL